MSTQGLEDAFLALADALARGDLDAFYGAMLPDAVIMDEDLPFRVDTEGFKAHIAFHGPDNWEGFAWRPHDMRYAVIGGSGAVVGFAMFRGKPRDAGFRLRPMMFTQGWTNGARAGSSPAGTRARSSAMSAASHRAEEIRHV